MVVRNLNYLLLILLLLIKKIPDFWFPVMTKLMRNGSTVMMTAQQIKEKVQGTK